MDHITIPILLIAVMSMFLVSYNEIFSLAKVEFIQETEEKFDTLTNRFYENGQFSRTILIAVDGEVVYKKALDSWRRFHA